MIMRIKFVSFRTFISPIFPKVVSWLGLIARQLLAMFSSMNKNSKLSVSPLFDCFATPYKIALQIWLFQRFFQEAKLLQIFNWLFTKKTWSLDNGPSNHRKKKSERFPCNSFVAPVTKIVIFNSSKPS